MTGMCLEGFWKVFGGCLKGAKSGQVKPDQVKTGQFNMGHVRSGQFRTGQVRTGKVRTGQVRTGQVLLLFSSESKDKFLSQISTENWAWGLGLDFDNFTKRKGLGYK